VHRHDDSTSLLGVLGLGPVEASLYRALLRTPGLTVDAVADVVGDADERASRVAVDEVVGRLVRTGLVRRSGAELVASPPEQALERLIGDEHERLEAVRDQLAALRNLLPALEAEHRVARAPIGEHVQVEAIPSSAVPSVLRSLVLESAGDLLWIRPDQWRLEQGRAVDPWVQDLLREGRGSRVIYPARVLEEAPDAVRRRAELGEHVRVLGDVPGRLAVVGDVAALIPQRFDLADDVVLVVRQPALVTSVTLLFEGLWERALVVPGIGMDDPTEGDSSRRLLLDQMARGAKDEQIARALGLSLRTVRRRVADLREELGADSRFQAGVEAVRRGWL
jgi:hypothetical protein